MKYIIKELLRHKWRTIANISGYTIATIFILLIFSVTSSNEKNSFGILTGTGTHFIVYIPSSTSYCKKKNDTGGVFAEGVFTQMLSRNMLNQVKNSDGVRDAAPYLLYRNYDVKFKTEISIGGIDTNSYATRTNVCALTNIIEGKYISRNLNEIVAEESFALAHNLHLGDTLNIFGCKLLLIGIINTGIKPAKADFYAPIENVRIILKEKLCCIAPGFEMNIILVEVADARNQEVVMKNIKNKLMYATISSYNCYNPARNVMSIIGKSSAIINVIIFLFLIIFAAKTQITSLIERLREIGILKSLGWSNLRISNQIIVGSIFQALIGTIIGSILSLIIILLMNHFKIQIVELSYMNIEWLQILYVGLLSLLGGLFASLFPIIRIYRLKAGDIMRKYL